MSSVDACWVGVEGKRQTPVGAAILASLVQKAE
jgi:hypothetical protein